MCALPFDQINRINFGLQYRLSVSLIIYYAGWSKHGFYRSRNNEDLKHETGVESQNLDIIDSIKSAGTLFLNDVYNLKEREREFLQFLTNCSKTSDSKP